VEDLTFQIDFGTIAQTDLIQFINHVTQIRANLLNFFVTLPYAISHHGFALAWILKFHALGKKLAFILTKVDFQDVIVGFLPEAVPVNLFRIGYAQTLKIIVHSGILSETLTQK